MFGPSSFSVNPQQSYFSFSLWVTPIGLAAILVLISFSNFLLFHTLVEFFAVTIAILTCVVAWNMYPFTRNNYLMFLGAGYFWVGLLDLLHTLTYKGMNVIPGSGANMAVQFWIGTRYLEALILLTAPWFLTHSLNRIRAFGFFAMTMFVISALIYFKLFPEGFVEGKGLTAFKIYSEYVIIFMLAMAIIYLYAKREFLERSIVNALIVSIFLTMCAELAFTFYVSVYGFSNLIGHIFKIFSFWLIFQAVIRTTLQAPFSVMSRGATTYDAIPDAAIVVDENGVIHSANSAAYSLANFSKGELIGKNNHEVFHAKAIDVENCRVCQAISNNEELKAFEVNLEEKNSWFDFSLSHIEGASELSGTVEVIRDITHRKSVENKIHELNILKNSIIENLPLMLFVKDANDHHYIEWNKAAEEITGILKEDVIGKTDFDLWPKEEAQSFVDKDKEVIKSRKLFDIAEEPVTSVHKGTRIVHTKKIPIFNQAGQAKYLLGITEDITDTLKTQEMLNRSQKMEVVGQMSGGIAHDFNNQLGVILGYIEMLLEQNLTEQQIKWLAVTQQAANRCAELTKQLLIFSRNDDVDKKSIDLNKVIVDMSEIISHSLTPAIKLEYYLSKNLWMTKINKGSCQDAILNLIINASDAMEDGGTLMIETTNVAIEENMPVMVSLTPGDYVQIMISDSGTGMSKEVSEHIFEPFYTTKDVGKGTGLGLSMVYSFIKRSGGDISLETDIDRGATFRIYLPRSNEQASSFDQKDKEEVSFDSGDESVLIVDDETTLLTFAEQSLKSWGYKVYRAENAEIALTILKNSDIDILFSDVVMPGGLNGYALAEKALNINSKIKVLLTSGYVDKMGSNKKYDEYNFQLLAKPYSRKDLSKKLRSILDGD